MSPLEVDGSLASNGVQSNSVQPEAEVSATDFFSRYHLDSMRQGKHCYPALKFEQGGRTMLQINVPAGDLPTLLKPKPTDPNKNDPHAGKNRPIDSKHAEEIKDYVVTRAEAGKKWILGTLTANIDPRKIEYQEIPGLWNMYLVRIPRGISLDITDGQHRTRAIQELIMSEGDKRDLISEVKFPITLVLEADDRQSQMDFRDMAQTRPIQKSLLVSFGANGRDGIAQEVVEQVSMFRRKTELIKSTPGSGSRNIYTINYIAQVVSLAFENELKAQLLDHDVTTSAEVLSNCLNLFFSECPETKDVSEKEQLDSQEAGAFRESCLLGTSVGLEILGRLLHHAYDQDNNSFDEEEVLTIAGLDWSRESMLWRGNVVREDTNPKDSSKPFKISASATNVSGAIRNAKEELGWNRK
ncbi:DNA sulfur modification protein DndB [Allocoleopsis sp.]|uniref:DNA sulfur modification protein DndB n=1 Tax=Allocoleopsis sp. TaxID=3088169 RepID=UPI002FCF45C0